MKPTQQQQILNLISEIRNSHSKMEKIFLYGSCINLFMILRVVYPTAVAYYNIDHIITKIGDFYYDITGIVTDTKGYIPFSSCYNKKRTLRAFTQMYFAEYKE